MILNKEEKAKFDEVFKKEKNKFNEEQKAVRFDKIEELAKKKARTTMLMKLKNGSSKCLDILKRVKIREGGLI